MSEANSSPTFTGAVAPSRLEAGDFLAEKLKFYTFTGQVKEFPKTTGCYYNANTFEVFKKLFFLRIVLNNRK
ncbi:hypothetical protein ADA01nite_11120 [Aneurinibacillus danicus]|uniref:Uncharacterized protein n=1 Tax=Aneurinibacillus danicus TaxID=267746 RepID=A0A511V8T7_9BACL|nr:hypothetical protein ADA01nite_11120 [Aneurinibacillus danicus]